MRAACSSQAQISQGLTQNTPPHEGSERVDFVNPRVDAQSIPEACREQETRAGGRQATGDRRFSFNRPRILRGEDANDAGLKVPLTYARHLFSVTSAASCSPAMSGTLRRPRVTFAVVTQPSAA